MNATFQIDPNPAEADTLPGWAYTSEDVLMQEREKIFYRNWHYAGAVQSLAGPGDYITSEVMGQGVVVMRGRDGVLRGFYNVCQHRAHELLSGEGNARVVTCPYHAWSYHDDGSLRTARGAERQPGFVAERFCLKPVRIEVFADKFVFFNLDPDATSMAAMFAEIEDEIRTEVPDFANLVPSQGRPARPMAANWKVVLDNYHECYHCGPSHQAFADLIDMAGYRTTTGRWWSKQAGRAGKLDSKAYLVTAEQNQTTRFWYLWPTTTIGFMPGEPFLSVTSIRPLSAGSSIRKFHGFARPGAVMDPVRASYNLDVLGPEDVSICESVQRGLASRGYTAGRYVNDPEGGQTTEAAVHHFHTLYAEAMRPKPKHG